MIHFFGILEPLTGKRQRADEAPRKMQAEEARAAGDRDEHGAEN